MFGHQDDQPAQDNAVSDQPTEAMAQPGEGAVPDLPLATDQSADADGPTATDQPDVDNESDALIITPSPEEPDPATVPQDDQSQDDTVNPQEPAAEPAEEHEQSGGPEAEEPPAGEAVQEPWQHPETPQEEPKKSIDDVISPAGGFPKKPTFNYAGGVPGQDGSNSLGDDQADSGANGNQADEELVHVKKQALEELSPLIDKLDLPPEEKFRTLMMMIQASDDERLVKAAYEAAHAIEDEKTRAQALLDVVNEVNYFTQQPPVDQAAEPEA